MAKPNDIPSSNLMLRSPHDPMDYGRRHSMPDADLAELNERQAQLRSIVAGLPLEAAVAELLLSSVRHAVDYISEESVADALSTIAAELNYGNYKFLDLYASIAAAFKIDMDDDY